MSFNVTKSTNIYAPLGFDLVRVSPAAHHPQQETSVTFGLLPTADVRFTTSLKSVSVDTGKDLNEPGAQFGKLQMHLAGGSVKTNVLSCGKTVIGSKSTRTGRLVGSLDLIVGRYFKIHETSIPATATRTTLNGKPCGGGGGGGGHSSCDHFETLFANAFDTKTDLDWSYSFTAPLPKGNTSLVVSTGLIYGHAYVITGISASAPDGLKVSAKLDATVRASIGTPFSSGSATYKVGKVTRTTNNGCTLASSTDNYSSGEMRLKSDLFGAVNFTATTATVQVQQKV
jgi:hypothetical protein